VQPRRLAVSFEPLNSSLPLSAPELQAHKATCTPVVLAQEFLKLARRQSVKLHKWILSVLSFNRYKITVVIS